MDLVRLQVLAAEGDTAAMFALAKEREHRGDIDAAMTLYHAADSIGEMRALAWRAWGGPELCTAPVWMVSQRASRGGVQSVRSDPLPLWAPNGTASHLRHPVTVQRYIEKDGWRIPLAWGPDQLLGIWRRIAEVALTGVRELMGVVNEMVASLPPEDKQDAGPLDTAAMDAYGAECEERLAAPCVVDMREYPPAEIALLARDNPSLVGLRERLEPYAVGRTVKGKYLNFTGAFFQSPQRSGHQGFQQQAVDAMCDAMQVCSMYSTLRVRQSVIGNTSAAGSALPWGYGGGAPLDKLTPREAIERHMRGNDRYAADLASYIDLIGRDALCNRGWSRDDWARFIRITMAELMLGAR